MAFSENLYLGAVLVPMLFSGSVAKRDEAAVDHSGQPCHNRLATCVRVLWLNAENYSETLLTILREHTADALICLQKINSDLPEKTSGVAIGIHPSQEPDGMFSIVIHLEGPDQYSLNKAIDSHRYLFKVRFENGVLTPNVPQFDPFDAEFEVNDVIVDTSVIWLREIWSKLDAVSRSLPVKAFGEDGYGTITPVKIR